MPEDLNRRTVIGAAWAVPVIVAAAAAPSAAASGVTPDVTMAWTPARTASRSGSLTLSIVSAGPAIPVGGPPLVLTIASLDGTTGEPVLVPQGASGSWLMPDPVIAGGTISFSSDGLPVGSGAVSFDYGLTAFTGVPIRLQATISRGSSILATGPSVLVAQPYIAFDQPSYEVDLLAGTVVTGRLNGGTAPSTLPANAFSFRNSSFRAVDTAIDPGTGVFSATILPNGFEIVPDVVTVGVTGYESGSAQLYPAGQPG